MHNSKVIKHGKNKPKNTKTKTICCLIFSYFVGKLFFRKYGKYSQLTKKNMITDMECWTLFKKITHFFPNKFIENWHSHRISAKFKLFSLFCEEKEFFRTIIFLEMFKCLSECQNNICSIQEQKN